MDLNIEYTVIGFHNKYAILNNPTFGQIHWPIKKLPDEIEINSTIIIGAYNPKDILNDLIS